jgi:hypothetical protein
VDSERRDAHSFFAPSTLGTWDRAENTLQPGTSASFFRDQDISNLWSRVHFLIFSRKTTADPVLSKLDGLYRLDQGIDFHSGFFAGFQELDRAVYFSPAIVPMPFSSQGLVLPFLPSRAGRRW